MKSRHQHRPHLFFFVRLLLAGILVLLTGHTPPLLARESAAIRYQAPVVQTRPTPTVVDEEPLASPTVRPSATARSPLTGTIALPRPVPYIVPHVVVLPRATPTPTRFPTPVAPTVPITGLLTSASFAEPSPRWAETENYLILGTDHRPTWGNWRTDVIMILGIDRAQNRAAVLSIPRDLYVEIPGYGWNRINTVDYAGENILRVEGGGPALVSATLEKAIGIKTDHWIRVRMDGFTEFVDAIGGVTIHLDCPFSEPILNLDTNRWDYFTLPAGDVYLDGEDAYWFVRLRLNSSDISRSDRQRQFLWALRDQALNANLLQQFPAIWSALSSSFTTDLALLDVINLASLGLSMDPGNVRAGGITLRDLQGFRTEQGAAVLRIADPAHVRAVVDGVWDAPPMAASNRQDTTTCKPLPQGPPTYLDVTPTPTPPADATPSADEAQPADGQPAEGQPPADQPQGGD